MSDIRRAATTTPNRAATARPRATIEQQLQAARNEASFDTRSEDEVKAQERVVTLERQLAEAQRVYTAKHPEIQRLETQLATARIDEAQAKTQAALIKRAPQKAEQTIAQLTGDRDRLRARIRELQAIEARLPRELATYQSASTRRRSSSSSWRRSSRPMSSRRRSSRSWPSATRPR